MKIIRQGAYSNIVRRISEEECISDAYLNATEFEGSASLRFKVDTFEITDAHWAIHRAPDPERRGEGIAEKLLGESAYIDDRRNSIRVLPDYSFVIDYNRPPGGWEGIPDKKQGLLTEPPAEISPEWKNIRELFNETLRGAYQGEAYLIEERGMGTLREYEAYWEKLKPGYCRPYVKGDMPALEEWPIYSGNVQHYRAYDLYNKYLHYAIMDNGDGLYYAAGSYSDSAHEMNIELTYDADGLIKDYDMTAVRVPFDRCRELDHLNPADVIGMNLRDISKRDIGKVLGGAEGCFHFVDILADIAVVIQDI